MGFDLSLKAVKDSEVLELIHIHRVSHAKLKDFLCDLAENGKESIVEKKHIRELEELVYKYIIKRVEIYDSSWNTVFMLKYLIKSGYTIHIEVSY